MFADATFDSQRADYSHRGWATLTSFALQAIAVMFLLMLPLFYTQVLPQFQLTSRIVAPQPEPLRVQQIETHVPSGGSISVASSAAPVLRQPPRIPIRITQDPDFAAPQIPFTQACVGACAGPADPTSGLAYSIGSGPLPAIPQQIVTRVRRTSFIMEGSLIHRVEPQYPAIAKFTHTEGVVQLAAVIGKDGAIENLQVLSGSPVLVGAAIKAVKQWRYRPYLLNGTPVEVDTRITVNFVLSK